MNEITSHLNDDDQPELPIRDESVTSAAVLREKLADAEIPGYQAEFDPEEAESAGAFLEDAMSEQDAIEGATDLMEIDDTMMPTFLDDAGPNPDLPHFVNTETIYSAYGWKPGESLDEAIARKKAQGV